MPEFDEGYPGTAPATIAGGNYLVRKAGKNDFKRLAFTDTNGREIEGRESEAFTCTYAANSATTAVLMTITENAREYAVLTLDFSTGSFTRQEFEHGRLMRRAPAASRSRRLNSPVLHPKRIGSRAGRSLIPLPMLRGGTDRRWLNLVPGCALVGCMAKPSCAATRAGGRMHVSMMPPARGTGRE